MDFSVLAAMVQADRILSVYFIINQINNRQNGIKWLVGYNWVLRDWKLSAGIHILCKPQNARKENASADSVENENERKQVDWLEKRIVQQNCQECRKDSTRKSVNIVYGSIISLEWTDCKPMATYD